MEPQLSVVSTSFNDAAYIPRFLEGIAAVRERTRAPLVVVDSDSTDGTDRLLEAGGATVVRCKATVGAGLNRAISLAHTPYVLVVDVDNDYRPGLVSDIGSLPPAGRIRVGVDSRYRNTWFALGRRETFLTHPFEDMGGALSTGNYAPQDFIFFARAPVDIHVCPNLGIDLKRERGRGRRDDTRTLFRFRNGWFQGGMTWKDVMTLLARMARAPGGKRYFASDVGVVAAHVLTLGRAGRRRPPAG